MANTNQILPFATETGANVLSPSTWVGRTDRQLGFVDGYADPQAANTALRQAGFVAAMIAQFTADYGPSNVNDDGNVPGLEADFVAALTSAVSTAFSGQYQIHFGTAGGTANALTCTTAPAPTSRGAGNVYVLKTPTANTGAATFAPNGLASGNVLKNGGAAVSAADIAAGGYLLLVDDGTNFISLPPLVSQFGGGGGGGGISSVAVAAPITGNGVGTPVGITNASTTAVGAGRVASSGEASSGISAATGGCSTPWITPEEMAAAILAATTGVGVWVESVHNINSGDTYFSFDLSAYDAVLVSWNASIATSGSYAVNSFLPAVGLVSTANDNAAALQAAFFNFDDNFCAQAFELLRMPVVEGGAVVNGQAGYPNNNWTILSTTGAPVIVVPTGNTVNKLAFAIGNATGFAGASSQLASTHFTGGSISIRGLTKSTAITWP